MTWLIVEDDPEIRNLVAVMMQVWGETPLALPDGNAAWRWLDSVVDGSFKGELPELALMDIRMPGHTGDQIAARMRLIERIKHIQPENILVKVKPFCYATISVVMDNIV